jgi:type VI protein secretion system component VasF
LRQVADNTLSASSDRARAGVRVPVWGWIAVALLLAVVYAVGYDQGMLLEPLIGKLSTVNNYLHEFFHDGRHLLGFPCH